MQPKQNWVSLSQGLCVSKITAEETKGCWTEDRCGLDCSRERAGFEGNEVRMCSMGELEGEGKWMRKKEKKKSRK